MATIKDVATRANVSISTVSHVINHTHFVSEDKTRRIQEAMEQLGYHPNGLARSLRMGDTKTIALIVPDISNSFFSEIARSVEVEGFKNGYNVFLCNSDGSAEKEKAYLESLIAKQVDGLIFISSSGAPQNILSLSSRSIPVVVTDREVGHPSFADIVLVDNERGGYEVGKYLIGLGHKRIACITGPLAINASIERFNGLKRACNEAGITIPREYLCEGNFQFSGGEYAVTKFLKLNHPPTAIFAGNDLMAIGAIRCLKKIGKQVPGDFSVIGFDDIILSSLISPALTTISQPISEIGKISVRLLLKRMKNATTDRTVKTLIPELIVRDSCGAPNEIR